MTDHSTSIEMGKRNERIASAKTSDEKKLAVEMYDKIIAANPMTVAQLEGRMRK